MKNKKKKEKKGMGRKKGGNTNTIFSDFFKEKMTFREKIRNRYDQK